MKKVPKSTENVSIIGELSDSLTSMGANDQEADAAGSRKDFVAKYRIVKKETKETIYWLTIIQDTKILSGPGIKEYIIEGGEILRIVSKIIDNTEKSSPHYHH